MQVLVNGICQGLLFALLGLSFSLVYNTTRVFHVALGAIYTFAPFILISCLGFKLPLLVCILVSFIGCGALDLLCENALHWPLSMKSAPTEVHLIGSLGMYLALLQVAVLVWGNESRVIRSGVDTVYTFVGIRIAQAQLLGGTFSLIILLLFAVWMRKTSFGIQFRAMADNPVLLSILGRNVRLLRSWLFVISSIFAAIVALATAVDVGFDPFGGLRAIILGMIATIIGGRGTFMGAAVAGFLLGIIRTHVVWTFSARWEEAITFILLTVILYFRPYGLFGRKLRLEEKV